MLELYNVFIPAKKLLFLALHSFAGKLCLSDNNCTTLVGDVHKCRPLGKVLTMNFGEYKLETMLELYKVFILAKQLCFKHFLVYLENCFFCVIIAVQLTGCAQM